MWRPGSYVWDWPDPRSAFDQTVRLLLRSEPTGDRRWYLNTVYSSDTRVVRLPAPPKRTTAFALRRTHWGETESQSRRPRSSVCSFSVTRSPGATRSARRIGSPCSSKPPVDCSAIVCRRFKRSIKPSSGMARAVLPAIPADPKRNSVRFRHPGPVHGERPGFDNAAVDSPSGPRPRLIRCDPGNTGHELCLEGAGSTGCRLAGTSTGQSAWRGHSDLWLERPDFTGEPAPAPLFSPRRRSPTR